MAKRPVSRWKPAKLKREETPLVVYLSAFVLGIVAYFVVGELVLGSRPHPVHWLAGLAGAVLGVPMGWLWYRWRGDVI